MNNIHYFLEADRRKRHELARLTHEALGCMVCPLHGMPETITGERLDPLVTLVSDGILDASELPSGNLGVIINTPKTQSLLEISLPPMSDAWLTPITAETMLVDLAGVARISVDDVCELVKTQISRLDQSISRYESILKRDLPEECTRQRKEFDSLRQHLAECRMLSLMRNFALSRDTMEDLVSLDVHIKAELAIKATGNN